MKMIGRNFLAGALVLGSVSGSFAIAAPAFAQSSAVKLESEIMVEKTETLANGTTKTTLVSPKNTQVVPGDKLIVTLKYTNSGAAPASDFVATNPLPAPVQFTSVAEDWADVSVDGGKTFGKLTTLTVMAVPAEGGAAVSRAATPEDVTTIRWAFATPIAPGAKGTLTYRGVVR